MELSTFKEHLNEFVTEVDQACSAIDEAAKRSENLQKELQAAKENLIISARSEIESIVNPYSQSISSKLQERLEPPAPEPVPDEDV